MMFGPFGVGPVEGARVRAETPRVGRRPFWPWIFLGLAALAVIYLIFKPRRSPEEIARIISDAQKLGSTLAPPAPAAAPKP